MPESEDEARARKQRMRERQEAEDARRSPLAQPNRERKKRVAMTSATLAGMGVAMWLFVWFVEVESEFGVKVLLFCATLWPYLLAVAAIGWIVHEALPDD